MPGITRTRKAALCRLVGSCTLSPAAMSGGRCADAEEGKGGSSCCKLSGKVRQYRYPTPGEKIFSDRTNIFASGEHTEDRDSLRLVLARAVACR